MSEVETGRSVGGSYAQADYSQAARRSEAHVDRNTDVAPIREAEPVSFDQAAVTPTIERVARVLAAYRASINGRGDLTSANGTVDEGWRSFVGEATAVLKSLREPDQAMLQAGDTKSWTAMISAALGEPFHRAETPTPVEIYQKPLG